MDAGELFVRIRPAPGTQAAFTAEASGPIAAAGRDLTKVFLGAFAIGGIATTILGVAKAATSWQSATAVLNQTIRDAGAQNLLYGKTVDEVLLKEARLKGFSSEDLASAFQRLVSVTHDSGKAFTDLSKAEDLARFRHIDLANAALLLAKAEQGKYQSLQRVGIVVPQITTQEDALKLAHERLLATGVKLNESYKEAYATELAAAKAADSHATSIEALALVQQRAGGAARVYADTAAGQFDRLKQDFDQFKISIGAPLLSGLATAAEGLGTFVTDATKSGAVSRDVAAAAHDIGAAFTVAKDAVETFGPPLLVVSDHLGGVVRVTELLAGLFVANKIGAWLAGIGAAEATVGAGTAEAAAGVTRLTAALIANTAALTANGRAAAADTVIYDAYGGTLATITVEETAAADAAIGLGAAVGGAAAGVGILAGAIGIASKALIGYLAVYETIKSIIPGQGDLGLDFSNSVAKDVTGANKSPYAQGTSLNDLYQQAFRESGTPAGKQLLDKTIAQAQQGAQGSLPAVEAGLKAGLSHAVRNAAAAAKTDATSGTSAAELKALGAAVGKTVADQASNTLQAAQLNLTYQQDQLALSYDRQVAPLNARIAAVQRQQAIISAGSDRVALNQLRTSIALPGDKALSTNTTEALGQLRALQAASVARTGHADPALAAFILQFRTAALTVTSDRLNLEKSAIDATHTAAEVRLQIAGDILKLREDVHSQTQLQAKIGQEGTTLQQLQKRIADIASQERAKQLEESRKQTLLLKKIHDRSVLIGPNGPVGTLGPTTSLAKNPGRADQLQGQLTGLVGR